MVWDKIQARIPDTSVNGNLQVLGYTGLHFYSHWNGNLDLNNVQILYWKQKVFLSVSFITNDVMNLKSNNA